MVASTSATSGSALNLPGMETFAVLDAITFTDYDLTIETKHTAVSIYTFEVDDHTL